jgi:hypothetical protein
LEKLIGAVRPRAVRPAAERSAPGPHRG